MIVGRERVLTILAQQQAVHILVMSDNLGMGELGQGITDVLRKDYGFGFMCFRDLEAAISTYNSLEIKPDDKLLIASAKLKNKIPHLSTPSEIFRDIDENRQDSKWSGNFTQAMNNLREKISQGRLKWYKSNTNIEALVAGGVAHEYEEKVLIEANSRGEHEFEIDEVVDVIMEMLMWKHRDTRLFSWLCNPLSSEIDGGMGWADGYENISVELRKQAGFS